ncbi:MAG: GNAT family N-acetyltransferase [Pseudomonadota bacterium]
MTDVRLGEAGDALACAAILNAWVDATDWMPRVHPPEDVEQHYSDFVFKKREVFVIGCPPTAYIALSDDNFVTSLFCAKPGHGQGKRLLDHAKTLRPQIKLWTFVANTGARRFYEREGFAEAERSNGDNEEKLPDILFRWEAA